MKRKLIVGIYVLAVIIVLVVSACVYMMTYISYRFAFIYSSVLSGVLIVLISIIVYLSMNSAGEPFYKRMAFIDMLTGYENRMAFEHRLKVCGPIADRGVSVTLMIFDLNTLKTINDTQGHKAGDIYLKNSANLIHKSLRGKAPLYRIGGDEFASILVGLTETDLQKIMHNLRNEKRTVYKNYHFDCAYGAATFTIGVDNSLRDVFKRADSAMYIVKKKQKNLVNVRDKDKRFTSLQRTSH